MVSILLVILFTIFIVFSLPFFKTYEKYYYLDVNSGLTYQNEIYLGFYEIQSRCHVSPLSAAFREYRLKKEPHKWITLGGIFYYGLFKGYACSGNKQILLSYIFLNNCFETFNIPKSDRKKITKEIITLLQNGVQGRELSRIIDSYSNKILDANT